jgi:large subunit ribosomal protein L18
MNSLLEKKKRLERRITRVRYAIKARYPRPRLVFNRSNKYLSAQIVDDSKGVTLVYASTQEKDFSGSKKNKEAAQKLGQIIAARAIEKGVKSVVLDRRGLLYHGRISMFADAAREKGLEF